VQKHHSKRKPHSRFRNWNPKIGASASETVHGTIRSLDGGEDFALSYLRDSFLTKFCDERLVSAADRRANAIRKLLEVERKNKEFNLLIPSRDPGYNIMPRVSYGSFLRFTRRMARDILGPLHDGVVIGSFTGGASTSRRRTESLPAHKFIGKADITGTAWPYIDVLHREVPWFKQYGLFSSFNEVKGNVLFTVPKKSDIDRCACKEPDINMFLQKGVGNHIRRRLKRFGINLNDQSRNRSLAKLGSVDSSLATIDLSSASDSLTVETVRAILPQEWFLYLDDIRSHYMLIDGEEHHNEMFSSMGNGFTFELESLIFFVLARAVSYFEGISGIISVYGDDIIVPSGAYDMTEWVLREFGFTVNPSKSFSTGFFRESCGGHYHTGEDVTPFYLKKAATHLTDVIRVANQLRLWSMTGPFRRYQFNTYQTWKALADMVPECFWGGYDYSLDTRLVTPPAPRRSYRLVRMSEEQKAPQLGLYAHWHNSNWNRLSDPEGSEDPVSTNQKCRRKWANPGDPVCQDWFLEELVHHAVSPG